MNRFHDYVAGKILTFDFHLLISAEIELLLPFLELLFLD